MKTHCKYSSFWQNTIIICFCLFTFLRLCLSDCIYQLRQEILRSVVFVGLLVSSLAGWFIRSLTLSRWYADSNVPAVAYCRRRTKLQAPRGGGPPRLRLLSLVHLFTYLRVLDGLFHRTCDTASAALLQIKFIIIAVIIYLLNKAIEKKKWSNVHSRAGQQGKGTDSCPEIIELHKTIQQTQIKIQKNICNHTNSLMN